MIVLGIFTNLQIHYFWKDLGMVFHFKDEKIAIDQRVSGKMPPGKMPPRKMLPGKLFH